MSRKLIPILDPPHGCDVPGKRSPDSRHLEYDWGRKICKLLEDELINLGFRVEYTNTEEREIGLSKRKQIAESIKCLPDQTKFLLSLHNNAAGADNNWHNARGVEIYTAPGQTKSDIFADIILNNLKEDFPTIDGFKYRTDLSDGDLDKEAKFTVLMGRGYSAILLEWLFQDNVKDLALLQCPLVNMRLVRSLCRSLVYIDEHLKEL